MTDELFTIDGKRKYLNAGEQARFATAATQHERGEVRTFCLVLLHTGCRISEALALTSEGVDLAEGAIVFRTLKQREHVRFRSVPVPESTLDALELVHAVRKAKRSKRAAEPLWSWGRTRAWQLVGEILGAAGIEGPHASPKGLRHGFGVLAADKTRNPRLVQRWLGHTTLETTLIYMDLVGAEEQKAARAMWAPA